MEEIVEVRGSSECFEYQFPASPAHFVGRQSILSELDAFVSKVTGKQTSARGILFEANSGWGKSSVVLASVARLMEMGHFAVAIDSRSATSSQFIMRVVDHVLSKFGDFGSLLSKDERLTNISGFDGVIKSLLHIGQILESHSKVLFIFLDQFENVFILPEALKRITDLLLKICDAQTNVVLGFSWKTDLVGLTSEFPYQLRDSIAGSSKHIPLETFSDVETKALLSRLSQEIHAPLRKDLEFFLSEFSQGYPWLLKKLCAHVKAQRETGVPQSELANSLLNVEELFLEDLRGLSPEQQAALRRIASAAPISVSELGEELRPEVVQSLVHRRLVVSIGHKLDVYWDIFRDYLNSGHVPVQENYILRVQTGSIRKAVNLLSQAGGALRTAEFQSQTGLTAKSLYNVARDLRLLGLAKIDNGQVILHDPLSSKEEKDVLRGYLAERLRRNRLVRRFLEELETRESLTLSGMSEILVDACPYISAADQTWLTYARVFADWMDFADLAIFDTREGMLTPYRPGTEVRERRPLLAKRLRGTMLPRIQYSPVEIIALALAQALKRRDTRIDWGGLKRSTIAKSLATLEDLGLIVRKTSSIEMPINISEIILDPEKRTNLFAARTLEKMEAFKIFTNILETYKDTGCTLSRLAAELNTKLGATWRDGTAETNAKIMLDWARHTKLAPGVFSTIKKRRTVMDNQMKLFLGGELQA